MDLFLVGIGYGKFLLLVVVVAVAFGAASLDNFSVTTAGHWQSFCCNSQQKQQQLGGPWVLLLLLLPMVGASALLALTAGEVPDSKGALSPPKAEL